MTLWFEELDAHLMLLVKTHNLLPRREGGYNINGRYHRAESLYDLLDTLLKTLAEKSGRINMTPPLKLAVRELKMAKRQFSDFDYKLIALCYGETVHKWRLRITNGLSAKKGVDVEPVRVLLDKYFRTNDTTHVGELLSAFRALPLYEDSVPVAQARAEVDALVDEIWIQGVLEGKLD